MGELALTEEIKTLGLEKHAEELERDGLTIVPPEVNGFGVDRIDEIVELILARAREMTGCTFTLDGGPQQELEFPKREFTPKQLERIKARGLDADELNRPTQFSDSENSRSSIGCFAIWRSTRPRWRCRTS